MSGNEAISEVVARLWIERTLASYPAEVRSSLIGEHDRFRNPAGCTIAGSLTTRAREVLGVMDDRAITAALDALVRMRAVQNFRPSAAVGFVFELRSVIASVCGEVAPEFNSRIDELALKAFDQYTECREQIARLREKELRARESVPAR